MGRISPSIVATPSDDDPLEVWYIFRVPAAVRRRAGGGRECAVKPEDDWTARLIQAAKALQSGAQQAGPAAAAGYSLIGSILFLGALGYGFDRWRGTAPTGVVVGMLLGVVVGFYILAKEVWRR